MCDICGYCICPPPCPGHLAGPCCTLCGARLDEVEAALVRGESTVCSICLENLTVHELCRLTGRRGSRELLCVELGFESL